MDELKRCPFCGGEAESKMYLLGETRDEKKLIWRFYAFCTKCNAMSDNIFESEEEAIAAWNRRYTEEARE